MAKRFGRKTRRFNAKVFGKRARFSRKGKSGENIMMLALASAAYGFGRPYLEKLIAPVTEKLPLGGYADEIVLGTAGYFMAKGKISSNPMVKNVGKAMLVIEAARLGANVGGNLIAGTSSSSSSNSASWYQDA